MNVHVLNYVKVMGDSNVYWHWRNDVTLLVSVNAILCFSFLFARMSRDDKEVEMRIKINNNDSGGVEFVDCNINSSA